MAKRFQTGIKSKKIKGIGTLDMKDFTCSFNKGELIFLTKVYKGGQLLGYYSHSPWSTTRDQEQGWYLIDSKTLEVLEQVESKTLGRNTGEYWGWLKSINEMYGKAQYLVNENGDRPWKMSDNQ